MGKKGGSSWLTAVKRAFRSPTKDPEKRNHARKDDDNDIQALQFEDDEEKKREKRRWLFRKPSSHETATPTPTQQALLPNHTNNASEAEHQRHAIAVAAVATAQAAMEVACLANPKPSPPPISNVYYYARAREQHLAAVIIQTAFRGYLARRALGALKGLVKLQALVRGHNVRKQAKMTLRCMQALVRVQSRILDQRIRQSHSHEGSCRNSTFSDSNTMSMWDPPRYVQDFSDRRSMSRDGGSSIPDDWDERSHTIEEVKAMLQSRKEAAFRRQRNLSQQLWRGGQNPSIGSEDEFRERQQERWMMGATKPWDNVRERASTTDHQIIDNVKTVEIDTSQPYSYLAPSNLRRSNQQHQRPSSPLHRPQPNRSPATPSPSRTAPPIQLRSASPRCSRELERNSYHSSAQTPSLRPNNYYCNNNGGSGSYQQARGANVATIMPNYMAATESAKARIRSQSAPRQRPSTPERERIGMGMGIGSAKKRLSFPVNNPAEGYGMGGYLHNLRSPSFKSVVSAFGYEQQSNYSSCCGTESVGGGGGGGGEVSPCTSDLRRWLR